MCILRDTPATDKISPSSRGRVSLFSAANMAKDLRQYWEVTCGFITPKFSDRAVFCFKCARVIMRGERRKEVSERVDERCRYEGREEGLFLSSIVITEGGGSKREREGKGKGER